MSLNYDLSALPEEVAFKGDQIDPITDALIWACMFVGIAEITATNVAEFYARLLLTEKLHGGLLKDNDGKPYSITLDDIRQRVGLKTDITNVGLTEMRGGETRAKWLRRYVGGWLDEAKSNARVALSRDLSPAR